MTNKVEIDTIKLTYVVPFYIENNLHNPLLELIDIYNGFDKTIIKQIHFVFVDDHSKIDIRIPKHINLNYSLLRIKDDIMWNQSGARNLGAYYAKSDKIILTDLDVIFPEHLLESLMDFAIPKDAIFKFQRICNLKSIGPHFNVFYTTKETFNKSRGVDEEFAGHYGHEDIFFYFLQKALGTKFYIYHFSNITNKEHKDSETKNHNSLVNDIEINTALNNKKLELMRNSKNPLVARSDLYLNFEWDVVQENTIL